MGSTIVINFIVDYFYYAFLGWILITLMQRRQGSKGAVKRMAVLYQAILIFSILVAATIFKMNELTDGYMVIVFIAAAAVSYFGRKKIFPYTTRCSSCGKRMKFERIFFCDVPLCADCDTEEIEEREKIQKELKKIEEEDSESE